MTVAEPRIEAITPRARPKRARTERARHERRLGLGLSAPAFIVMIIVTAYPLIYAVVLSLYRYRLTDPEGKEFCLPNPKWY